MGARGLPAQRRISKSGSIPAPIGGWNARDSVANMESTDAVTLINWFPTPSDVMLRNGYTNFATGLGTQGNSLVVYNGVTASKMFAFAGSNAYDVTSGGAVGAAALTMLTNDKWQYVNMATGGSNYVLCVNGADKLRGFNGLTWYTDGDGSHDITGVNTTTISQINLFKFRVWLIPSNSLTVYYLPTAAIAGAVTAFDLSGVARLGGYIVAMGTWTLDSGYGADDYAVFLTSKGEAIVYRGTDPASSTTWFLSGVWQIAPPVGRRCFQKFSGDLLLACLDGLVPFAKELITSRVNPRVALTEKIQQAINDAITAYQNNFGWEIVFYPKGNMVLLNVPVNPGTQSDQYVMNTITGSWCRFQGWNASCWAIFNDTPYFCAPGGIVGQAWNGSADNGTSIKGTGKQAFNYFESRGVLKAFKMARPILTSNGTPSISMDVNVDFAESPPSAPIAFTPSSYAVWDTALWDQAIWGSDGSVLLGWQGISGVGMCAAPYLICQSQGITVRWAATDIVYEEGIGVIG